MAVSRPSFLRSVMPIAFLLLSLVSLIIFKGASSIGDYSPFILLCAAALALLLSPSSVRDGRAELLKGMHTSARQILPAVPILIFIALLSTTWMLGGIVPTFIHYGLQVLEPRFFLVSVCAVCGCISIFTGSSWTTIATIGVAFMGIGSVMGYEAPWIAGAVISGAYFGDKVSPLSDTTVVASSSCGVDLFTHIRYMMFTTVPSMVVSLAVFLIAGLVKNPSGTELGQSGIVNSLNEVFVVTPLAMIVPIITVVMIAARINTIVTLATSAVLGIVSMVILQPSIPFDIRFMESLWGGAVFDTPDAGFNDLVSTSGLLGMMPTVLLVLSAMLFGGVMIGTGMLGTISGALTSRLRNRGAIIGTTVGSGLLLNSFTADQYLSLIIGANTFRDAYVRKGYEPKLLSRTLEDSISVTSVLVPWNSCGLTQSAVLGVPTIMYLPYCVFNYLSPMMSIAISVGVLGLRNGIKRGWFGFGRSLSGGRV